MLVRQQPASLKDCYGDSYGQDGGYAFWNQFCDNRHFGLDCGEQFVTIILPGDDNRQARPTYLAEVRTLWRRSQIAPNVRHAR